MKSFELYRNLTSKTFSIRDQSERKIVDYADDILFWHDLKRGGRPKIVNSGMERARRERQRNVHAFLTFPHYAALIERNDKVSIVALDKDRASSDVFAPFYENPNDGSNMGDGLIEEIEQIMSLRSSLLQLDAPACLVRCAETIQKIRDIGWVQVSYHYDKGYFYDILGGIGGEDRRLLSYSVGVGIGGRFVFLCERLAFFDDWKRRALQVFRQNI